MDKDEKELLDISYQIRELIVRGQNKDKYRRKLNRYIEFVEEMDRCIDVEIEDTKKTIKQTQEDGLALNSIELEGCLRGLLLVREGFNAIRDSVISNEEED